MCFSSEKRVLGTFHVSGKDIMSIYEMVVKIAKYFNYSCDNLNKINTSSLSQKAKRPPKTGFILDKAMKYLNYKPHSFEECLGIIDKQLNKPYEKKTIIFFIYDAIYDSCQWY